MSTMERRDFLRTVGAAAMVTGRSSMVDARLVEITSDPVNRRKEWIERLTTVATPVLTALAEDQLKARMPVEARTPQLVDSRRPYTHLEAFGRLLSGMAPWLDLPEEATTEGRERSGYFELTRHALANAVNPASNDCMNFSSGTQPLVDAAFLALALHRSPRLWNAIDDAARRNVVRALRQTRVIRPGFNNWLLFAAMIEAFLLSAGEESDRMRIDYALRQHEQWYKGDGMFGDGPEFHWDYYNSYVIQPFMRAVLSIVAPIDKAYAALQQKFDRIASRYAEIQERLIAPDGSFPVIGRSIAYRCGAFHHLANEALLKRLPPTLPPAQVRCALWAVIDRTLSGRANFDPDGWLVLGVQGHQPRLAENYISTGSLYLAATAFLPLGLPADSIFWSADPAGWTSKNVWNGSDLPADAALKL